MHEAQEQNSDEYGYDCIQEYINCVYIPQTLYEYVNTIKVFGIYPLELEQGHQHECGNRAEIQCKHRKTEFEYHILIEAEPDVSRKKQKRENPYHIQYVRSDYKSLVKTCRDQPQVSLKQR